MIYTVLMLLAACAVLLLLFDRLLPLTAARLGFALERRRSGLRLRSADIPGFTLPYLEGGSGETLVLIHGFGGDKDNFTRMARFLTPHYRVICPDQPGFGDATRDPLASYTIAEQVERMRELFDRIAPGRIHLGGNSMGGFIAAQFAATYPERVASLWLLDAAGTEASLQSDILQRYRDSGEMPLLLHKPQDIHNLIATCTCSKPFLPSSVYVALGRRGAADLALHTRIMVQLANATPLEHQYRDLATPTLIVWGQQDKILHPDGAAALRTLFPRSQTVMMPRIGHLPMLEAPRRSARDYLAFRRGSATG